MTNNTFKVHINGQELKDGQAVFPFEFSDLLDEQLDEAQLTIVLSETEFYEPLTEVKIEMLENDIVVKTKEYIVSNPTSYEMPIGE